MPIHAPFWGVFGAHFPHMMSRIVLTQKGTIRGLNHVIWAINRENRSRGSSWACEREKRTGQDRKKVTKGLYSPICEGAPTEAMYMKICVVGDVLDVITCAKFQNKIFRGYNFTGGRIFHFSYWFWMGLTTVQRCATALPVIIKRSGEQYSSDRKRIVTSKNWSSGWWALASAAAEWHWRRYQWMAQTSLSFSKHLI